MKSFFSPRNAFIGGVLLGLIAAAVMLVPQGKPRGFDVDAFGHLPALEGGRVKPIDSIARNTLLMIKGKQSLRFDPDGDGPQRAVTVGPDEWLLDVLFRPEVADKQKLFMIHNPDVLGLMNQQITSEHDYAFETIKPFIPEIQRQGELAQRKEPKERSAFESAVANLYERLFVYVRLKNTLQLEGTPGIAFELASLNGPQAAQRRSFLNEAAYFRPVPNAGSISDGWQNMGMALDTAARGSVNPALDAWSRMALAYRAQDPGNFNKAVKDAGAAAAAVQAGAASEAGAELVFNRAQPFYVGMVIYVLAMLAVFVSWLWQGDFFRSAGYGLLLSGAVVHTGGLISRVILQGRPPVTNLYSSAVFVGWGAIILGVILERMYRKGFGTVVAAAAGFASLIVAHHLTGDGDTMEMMRAVLDNNFWLGTHVITITIGYSGTFLAGGIAIAWTIWKHVTKGTDANVSKVLYGMTYGVICFALFFSFIGTVLGGIWADQSWGRFWGWDPKENGALLLVLWNAIILHARWGGYARERGIMAMAIFGNVITSLSWFGVNMLGVGLHSYGFMDKAFYGLTGFIASQLVIMAFTFAPAQFWKGLGGAPGKSHAAATGGR